MDGQFIRLLTRHDVMSHPKIAFNLLNSFPY